MLTGELENQILAIFFVAKEPVTFSQLQEIYPSATTPDLKEALQHLISNFNSSQKAMEIREVGGGYRMTSLPEHHEIIHRYLKTKPSSKLSFAALETLSVIAYKQPVTVPEIMEIRGVRGTSTIRTLLEKRLIEIRGRKKAVGRPIMYGTSKDFLLHFGLKNLSDLPTLDELEEVLSQPAT